MSRTNTVPARGLAGNKTGDAGLVIAAAVSQTVGDIVSEYYNNTTGSGAGLRGGTFAIQRTATGYDLVMQNVMWTTDMSVSGTIAWDQLSGAISATTTFTTTDGHSGAETIDWNDREREAEASLTGKIDGAALHASMLAP